jgi:hypothetical protein
MTLTPAPLPLRERGLIIEGPGEIYGTKMNAFAIVKDQILLKMARIFCHRRHKRRRERLGSI